MPTSESSRPVRFLFLFRDSQPEVYGTLPEAERRELIRQWTDWLDRLIAQGHVHSGYPLEYRGWVVTGANGKVTDGPYAESKESVAGYFMLTVSDEATALRIARECPSLRLGISVEVRPVAEFSPALKDLRGRSAAGDAKP